MSLGCVVCWEGGLRRGWIWDMEVELADGGEQGVFGQMCAAIT